MSGVAFGLASLGCMLLSLSLPHHFRHVWPESTDYSQWVLCNRLLGFILVCVALVPCVLAYGMGPGLLVWIAILALAALAQALLLTYWPRRSLLFSGASVALVVAGLLV